MYHYHRAHVARQTLSIHPRDRHFSNHVIVLTGVLLEGDIIAFRKSGVQPQPLSAAGSRCTDNSLFFRAFLVLLNEERVEKKKSGSRKN